MFSFLNKKASLADFLPSLKVDFHSHLIPNVDDGVKDSNESIELLKGFQELGYTKEITTPHIFSGVYENSTSTLLPGYEEVKVKMEIDPSLNIEFEFAAEYYVDEQFLKLVKDDASLLLIKGKYLLIETGFFEAPLLLDEAIFSIRSKNLFPILAHPERYSYLLGKEEKALELMERGVHLQVNLLSLTGHYGEEIRKAAKKLLDMKAVSFLGSDCHNLRHQQLLNSKVDQKLIRALEANPIKNPELL